MIVLVAMISKDVRDETVSAAGGGETVSAAGGDETVSALGEDENS